MARFQQRPRARYSTPSPMPADLKDKAQAKGDSLSPVSYDHMAEDPQPLIRSAAPARHASSSWPEKVYYRLYAWRRPVVLICYGLLAGLGYLGGFLLRYEFSGWSRWGAAFLLTVPLVVILRAAIAHQFRLSIGRWRFISTVDVLRLLAATTAGTILLLLVRELLKGTLVIPRSVVLIEWVLTTQLTAALWLSYRTGFERLRHSRWNDGHDPCKRVLIIGAGEAGNMLAREIQRYPTGYELVGFVDDDPLKWGDRIRGMEVIGGTMDLVRIAEAESVEELILAVPSAEPGELRRLVEVCEAANLPFKVLPGIEEVLQGDVRLSQLRELQIEDLLGREPVELELPELAQDLGGRCVLITGAAGSIGSELARQVALHRPGRLVLFDQAETALFYLELDLRREYPDLEIYAVIGDVVDETAVRSVFEEHRPNRAFHAAAYKHVPLMEANPEQAIRNNVIGTRIVAEEAGLHSCEKFVLVSTDKAVRPKSVMGATKRLAELVVVALEDVYPATAFGAVRFGNVLGSNGSVIRIFQKQIERVQPLTITHPDVTRYFMTIQEAVQLILQASLLEEFRGRIAMLDMGEPVRIIDLARNMLRLAGIPPEVGTNLIFTGLRPGEKLHEELAAPTEKTAGTCVPKVKIIQTRSDGEFPVLTVVDRWTRLFGEGRGGLAAEELKRIFAGLGGGRSIAPPPRRAAQRPAMVAADAD